MKIHLYIFLFLILSLYSCAQNNPQRENHGVFRGEELSGTTDIPRGLSAPDF